jgi:Fis family transcriptional regulator, factor for inversion stimulation protein
MGGFLEQSKGSDRCGLAVSTSRDGLGAKMTGHKSLLSNTGPEPVSSVDPTGANAVSMKSLFVNAIRDMRSSQSSYANALRAFQRRYIIEVLITNAFHLGRAALELGMHRNTLTRTIRDLDIDVRQIRILEHEFAANRTSNRLP